ncbi:WAT1-related protein At1g01070-like [Syzygium oleosum]|uniref:WAT1-related protein At1g01070-like n=1 Tax=Syzygium oleosum TaxID=219896 RepID=UPI0024B89008|nr:WAT1-related protein At1g01070-like [Syzygium oleosum]
MAYEDPSTILMVELSTHDLLLRYRASAAHSQHTLFKAANSRGMSYHVFLVYAYAIASLLHLPAPFFSLKSGVLPPLRLAILAKIGFLGLIGGFSQILGYAEISMSSPTLGSAISNLTPALTFILAILFRNEKVSLSRRSSQAKIIGTVMSISGASVITLYKGLPIIFNSKPSLSLYPLEHSSNSNWVVGGILLTAEYILVTLWYILLVYYTYFHFVLQVLHLELDLKMMGDPTHDRAETNNEGVSGRNDRNLLLQWGHELPDRHCLFSNGIRYECLESAGYRTGLCNMLGPFWTMLKQHRSHMGNPVERPFLCRDVQAIVDSYGCRHGYLLSWRHTLSQKSYRSDHTVIGFYIVMWGKGKYEMVEESAEIRLESPSFQKVPLLRESSDK